ncbi:hypothetical protein HHK36_006299 [Tetracentron sinense]|uniref:Leucine-rich repeat-containing N-terminal plant-type domain-containing protein n=1 Tax=Tetracentron sinense TaxID=13715 RepID=A0A835DKR1_TETSI|nr:hypothetical protein HHK36_006299 [Tetracentron sinense]
MPDLPQMWHDALKCWHRFNHTFQPNDIPQALAAMHLSDSENAEWFLNTGATAHITDNPGKLFNLNPYKGKDSVMVGNGNLLKISHIGEEKVSNGDISIPLKNVLLVPKIKKSLLSVSQLTSDYPYYFEFDKFQFAIKDRTTHRVDGELSTFAEWFDTRDDINASQSFTQAALPSHASAIDSATITAPICSTDSHSAPTITTEQGPPSAPLCSTALSDSTVGPAPSSINSAPMAASDSGNGPSDPQSAAVIAPISTPLEYSFQGWSDLNDTPAVPTSAPIRPPIEPALHGPSILSMVSNPSLPISEDLGCLANERMGLLEFKASVNWTNFVGPLLPSWVDDRANSDCCVWERVKCNRSTGRVIELSLSDTRESYVYSVLDKHIWFLNVSLFLPFEELQLLDLSFNSFDGWLINEGFERLSRLKRLEFLNLDANNFGSSILPSLGALTSLKSLSLRDNTLGGSFPAHELANLINLEILDLRGNQLIGIFPPSMALISLKALSLSFNKLEDPKAIQGLCGLKNLQELDLTYNNLSGIIPPCLSNLTSLRKLDLSNNQLRGKISASLIASLTSLEYIFLSNNYFEGTFSFSAFANHSMLKAVILENDDNKLELETEHPSWVPKFQLKILVLSNCNLHKIPKYLSSQYDLRGIDLSYNKMYGRFPTWLVENNTRMEFLNLRENSLKDHFQLPPYRYLDIYWIDISDNYFDGELQENIGEILPNLEYLNLSRNALQGDIPSSIGDMSKIMSLDLSNNNFSGEIPEHLGIHCNSLKLLKLSNNSLNGQIFPLHFNLSGLRYLDLDNNQFTGNILEGLSKSLELKELNIGNNYISVTGRNSAAYTRPNSNFTSLETLVMRQNFLEGSIPNSFLNSSYLLMTLDIRDNKLFGRIPSSISALSELRILSLKGNHLNGSIPTQLCEMNKIDIMDLSHNTFSGSIPTCLNNITFGRTIAIEDEFEQGLIEVGDFSPVKYYPPIHLLEMRYEYDLLEFVKNEEQEEVEFTTKSRRDFYKGDILNFMSGLDLSCNHLTGDIPHELEELGIYALNLSGNHLTGSIPKSFSNLKNIESLDLSHNELSGEIPTELTTLYTLEVFTVANNNLSGKTPDPKAQFATFDHTSYEGNPFLYGLPLQKNCTPHSESLPSIKGNENMFDIDFVAFYASFVALYIIFLLGFGALLCINPFWRRMWFDLIDMCIHSCFLFSSKAIYKLSAHIRN